MDCREAQEKLTDLVAGRLPAEEAREVEGHVGECPDCTLLRKRLTRTSEMLRHDAPVSPSPELWERVQDSMKHPRVDKAPTDELKPIPVLRPAAWMPYAVAAACFSLALLVGWLVLRQGPERTVAQPEKTQKQDAPKDRDGAGRRRIAIVDDVSGMRIERLYGGLAARDAERGSWRQSVTGEPLPYGAEARLSPGALAELGFGTSRVRLMGPASFKLARSEKAGRALDIAKGRALVSLTGGEGPFEVRTPRGTVEVTGTVVEVEVPSQFAAVARVKEGKVVVRGKEGGVPVSLAEGQEVAVGKVDPALSAVVGPDKFKALAALENAPRSVAGKDIASWAGELDKPRKNASASVGQLLVQDDQGRESVPLTVGEMAVKVDIHENFALTEVDQTFLNHTDRVLEGTLYFPLPADASICRFAMYVTDESLVEGEVVERRTARAIYESILRRKQDPALLEWMEGNIFKTRIFPIPANGHKRIIMQYVQLLPAYFDEMRYVYPLCSSLTEEHPIGKFSFEATVRSAREVRQVRSPSHPKLKAAFPEAGACRMAFASESFSPDMDFILLFNRPRGAEAYLLPYGEPNEDPYFLISLQPDVSATGSGAARAKDRDYVFLFDTSGTRKPAEIAAQAGVLRTLIEELDANDRAAIGVCDVGVRWLTKGLIPRGDAALPTAVRAAEREIPMGACDFAASVSEAVAELRKGKAAAEEREPVVVFLGGGVAALGEMRGDKLIEQCAAALRAAGARFYAIALGSSTNPLVLRTLAKGSGGAYLEGAVGQELEQAAFQYALSLKSAPIGDLRIALSGVETHDVVPAEFGTVLPGEEIFVFGRAKGAGKMACALSARYSGADVKKQWTFDVKSDPAEPLVGRFWARAVMDSWLALPQTQELKQRIIALCKAWTLVSPYTSFLVLETEQEYERYGIDRTVRRPIRRDQAKANPPKAKVGIIVPAEVKKEAAPPLVDPWSGRTYTLAAKPAEAARAPLPAVNRPAPQAPQKPGDVEGKLGAVEKKRDEREVRVQRLGTQLEEANRAEDVAKDEKDELKDMQEALEKDDDGLPAGPYGNPDGEMAQRPREGPQAGQERGRLDPGNAPAAVAAHPRPEAPPAEARRNAHPDAPARSRDMLERETEAGEEAEELAEQSKSVDVLLVLRDEPERSRGVDRERNLTEATVEREEFGYTGALAGKLRKVVVGSGRYRADPYALAIPRQRTVDRTADKQQPQRKAAPDDVRKLLASRPVVGGMKLTVKVTEGSGEPRTIEFAVQADRIQRAAGGNTELLEGGRSLRIEPADGQAYLIGVPPEGTRRAIHALFPYLLLETPAEVEARYDAALADGGKKLFLNPVGLGGVAAVCLLSANGAVESVHVFGEKDVLAYRVELNDPRTVAGTRIYGKVTFVGTDGKAFRTIEVAEAKEAQIPTIDEALAGLKGLALRRLPLKDASQYAGETAPEAFHRGLAHLAARKFRDAAFDFAVALRGEPDSVVYRFYKGYALLAGGSTPKDYDEARKELMRVLNSEGLPGLAASALAVLQSDSHLKPGERLAKLLEGWPREKTAAQLWALSDLALAADNAGKAAEFAEKAVALRTDPKSPATLGELLRLASIQFLAKQGEKATATLERARKEAKGTHEGLTRVASMFASAEHYKPAKEILTAVLKAVSEDKKTPKADLAQAYMNLAAAQTGFDGYVTLCDGIMAFDGEGAEAMKILRALRERLGDETRDGVLGDAAGTVKAPELRSLILRRQAELTADAKAAAELWERAYEDGGKGLSLAGPYIEALTKAGRTAKAIEVAEELVRGGCQQPWVYERLGALYREMKADPAKLNRALTAQVALRPRDAEPRVALAAALAAAGDRKGAIQQYRAACEFRPEDAANFRNLLKLSREEGDRDTRRWAAIEMLTGQWQSSDGDVWGEAEKEMKAIADELRKEGKDADADKVLKDLAAGKAIDICVVLKWNTAGTDVDLHVEEPGKHEVSYQSRTSFRGGVLDHDDTDGYGPETYTLKRAAPGKYVVQAKYFGDHGKGPSTCTVEVYRNRHGANETKNLHTVKLNKTGEVANVETIEIPRQ